MHPQTIVSSEVAPSLHRAGPARPPATGGHANIFEALEGRRLLSGQPFEFFGGRAVVEAEDFDASTPRGSHAWQIISDASGIGGVQVLPDIDARVDADISQAAAQLDYAINFPAAGTYFITIRGDAVAGRVGESDSVHVGLDGVAQAASDKVHGFGADWTWSSQTMDAAEGGRLYVEVPSAGVHRVNLYMREDGFAADRFLVTRALSFPVHGAGPRASERPTGGSIADPAAVTGSLADPDRSAGPAEVTFDGLNRQAALHLAPLSDGRFYLSGSSSDSSGNFGGSYITRHHADGSLDTTFGAGGRRVLEPGQPATFTPLAAGGFFTRDADGVRRFDDNLEPVSGYGVGGVVAVDGWIDHTADGRMLVLSSDQAQWSLYDAHGQLLFTQPAGDLLAGATTPDGLPYTSVTEVRAFADGSALLVLQGASHHGFRKLGTDLEVDTAYAGDGTADKARFDMDSYIRGVQIAADGRVFAAERDTDGEDYMTVIDPSGMITASNAAFFLGEFMPYDAVQDWVVRSHENGDYSVAYTIYADDPGHGGPSYERGFGVERFKADGSLHAFGRQMQQGVDIGDDTLDATDVTLLPDGTFLFSANAGSDALLWLAFTGSDPLTPHNEVDGRVDVQAEVPTGGAAGAGSAAGHAWTPYKDAAATGGAAIVANPNVGVNTGSLLDGPRSDYAINFTTTGTYYVWARMAGASGSDDSLHIGLNGSLLSSSGNGVQLATAQRDGRWNWLDRTSAGVPLAFTVSTTGVHTLNLWMREDGMRVDEFIIVQDAAFNPTGVYQQDSGRLDIQAEASTGAAAGSGLAAGHVWQQLMDTTAGGGQAIAAEPNSGINLGSDTSGPRRDYAINFTSTGTFYVWVRMAATSGSDDSLHVGVDGGLLSSTGQGVQLSTTQRDGRWQWLDRTSAGTRLALNLTTAGVHTLNLWMREDGMRVDQFTIVQDPYFHPTGIYQENAGRIEMQAERSTGAAAGSGAAAGHTWQQVSDATAGGGQAIVANPNSGLNVGSGTNGPRRDYAINFTSTGTYYAWVRMAGASGDDDSLHVGLNGSLISSSGQGVALSPAQRGGLWHWLDRTNAGVRLAINIATPGVHTSNLWMREDGARVDQFILTKDAAFVPA